MQPVQDRASAVTILPALARLCLLVTALGLAGCAAPREGPPPPGTAAEIDELRLGLLALGPDVDPEEAARAARLTYETTHRLALEYQIVDPPLVHNAKVNAGLKPRGLCWHWSVDLGARLEQENFETLEVHYAIANAFNPFRIEHSTAILSSRGDSMYDGIVVDPWRKGGVLFWSPIAEDVRYDWQPRMEVFARKRAVQDRREELTARESF